MSYKTIIMCDIRFCRNRIITFNLINKKEYEELMKKYKWLIIKDKCYCPDCQREKLI